MLDNERLKNLELQKFDDEFRVTTNQETDIIVPFFKVIQNLSNELIQGKDKYNPNVKAGDIYDSVTQTAFKSAPVIICGMRKYYAEWTPEIRGRIVGKHLVQSDIVKNAQKYEKRLANGTLSYGLKTQSGNDLQESYCVVLIVKTDNGLLLPGRLTLSKTSYIVGKELNTMLGLYQKGGVQIYTLTTNLTSNSKGSWYKPVFTFAGYEQEKNIIHLAIMLNRATDRIIFQ